MQQIPTEIYSVKQVRQIEQSAFDSGLDGAQLMARAGLAGYRLLRQRWPRRSTLIVYCGSGNNGGDGYIIGQLALQDGLNVGCIISKPPTTKLAQQASSAYIASGGKIISDIAEFEQDDSVIVDALLGIGLHEPVREPQRSLISTINRSQIPVLAIDIPSGIDADSGQCLGSAVRASHTLSFIGLKPGNLIAAGQTHNGELTLDHLDIPQRLFKHLVPTMRRITPAIAATELPKRSLDQHKGQCGRVLIVGGQQGMTGAVDLASKAAYRSGSGLVQVAFIDNGVDATQGNSQSLAAEVITLNDNRDAFDKALKQADVIAAGPGMGTAIQSQQYLSRLLELSKPLVLDADALNLLTRQPEQRNNWVLTPHPGEAAQLLATTTANIQQDRIKAVQQLSQQYGGVIVLKGARTLIASEGRVVHCCSNGHSGMATAGMGDVLTGMIASLIGQGMSLFEASVTAVWCHAWSADKWSQQHGLHGMIASDISELIPDILNEIAFCRH